MARIKEDIEQVKEENAELDPKFLKISQKKITKIYTKNHLKPNFGERNGSKSFEECRESELLELWNIESQILCGNGGMNPKSLYCKWWYNLIIPHCSNSLKPANSGSFCP